MHDGAGHILIPDENKRARAAPDGQQARFFEQRGDLVVHTLAQDGVDAQHGLRQCGMVDAVLRQHLFHQPLVMGIGKHLVAAQRIGLAQPGGVVGVVAIGSPAGADHDVLDPCGHTGVEHIFAAQHIHGILKLAVGAFARCDDGGQMHHAVDGMVGERMHQRGVAHVLHQIDHAGQTPLGRHLAHIGGHQRGYAFARKRRHHAPA
ncbi:hypothetical protein D3C71_1460410 [compost metagenome]